ncbi:MAG: CPBP family intramembrane metalloprotease [Alistipes sp.]|nr:CPBP family intramembrane metalloprotease [Alistipes sp.]
MESKRGSAWADIGVLAAILFGATLTAGGVVAGFTVSGTEHIHGATLFTVYTVQFVLAIVGGYVWLKLGKGSDSKFSLRLGVSWADGPLILSGIVVATAAGIVIEPLLGAMPEHYIERLNEMIGHGGWAIITTVVAAPIFEEIFFRGMVLEGLARRWAARWAVLGSAALFGLVHLPILPQMVNAFVIAIIMGYIYLIPRSLIPVIVIHAINNGLAYLILEFRGSQGVDTRDLIGNDTIYLVVYAVSAVVMVVSLVVMNAKVRTKTARDTLKEKTADE